MPLDFNNLMTSSFFYQFFINIKVELSNDFFFTFAIDNLIFPRGTRHCLPTTYGMKSFFSFTSALFKSIKIYQLQSGAVVLFARNIFLFTSLYEILFEHRSTFPFFKLVLMHYLFIGCQTFVRL